MVRRRCSTTSARRTSSPARRAASRSTSARTTSRCRTARPSPSSTRRATRHSPPCVRAARRSRTSSCSSSPRTTQVMPQTIEAISHAKNAGVPMIVAINKIDLPRREPDEGEAGSPAARRRARGVRRHHARHRDLGEEGNGRAGRCSSRFSCRRKFSTSRRIRIAARAASSSKRSSIRARVPSRRCSSQNGTLNVGDDFICGMFSGRVRALLDERGKPVKRAGPAIPVQVLGIGRRADGRRSVPASSRMRRRRARSRSGASVSIARRRAVARTSGRCRSKTSCRRRQPARRAALRIVIKADQGGPAEALADALGQLSHERSAASRSFTAASARSPRATSCSPRASGAIIIGFHVRPDNNARAAAEREGVDIKLYRIIYEAVADVRAALEGHAASRRARSRARRGRGARDVQGSAHRRHRRLLGAQRRHQPRRAACASFATASRSTTAAIGSLRRFKDDVKEVREGFECGIGIENFNDLKVGDVIECYRTEQVARTL